MDATREKEFLFCHSNSSLLKVTPPSAHVEGEGSRFKVASSPSPGLAPPEAHKPPPPCAAPTPMADITDLWELMLASSNADFLINNQTNDLIDKVEDALSDCSSSKDTVIAANSTNSSIIASPNTNAQKTAPLPKPISQQNCRKRLSPGLPHTPDCSSMSLEEARKAQRMARNRKAAATSRARKREQLEQLNSKLEELQKENAELRALSMIDGASAKLMALKAENDELRQRLIDAGLMSMDQNYHSGDGPYTRQPAALCLENYSPQLEYHQPIFPMILLPVLLVHFLLMNCYYLQTLPSMTCCRTYTSPSSLTTPHRQASHILVV